MKVYCWRSGQIGFGQRVPRGALKIAAGPAKAVREAVCALARHAYDGKSLLVPGLPEADSDVEAMESFRSFRTRVLQGLS